MTNSRKHCLSGESCTPTTADEALYCQLHHSARTLPEIAQIVGKRPGYLMDVGNPDREDHRLPADLIQPLRWASENTVYIERLSMDCGGLWTPRPRVAPGGEDVIGHAANVMGTCGRALDGLRTALLDGRVTASEADAISLLIDEGMSAMQSLRLLVTEKASQR